MKPPKRGKSNVIYLSKDDKTRLVYLPRFRRWFIVKEMNQSARTRKKEKSSLVKDGFLITVMEDKLATFFFDRHYVRVIETNGKHYFAAPIVSCRSLRYPPDLSISLFLERSDDEDVKEDIEDNIEDEDWDDWDWCED